MKKFYKTVGLTGKQIKRREKKLRRQGKNIAFGGIPEKESLKDYFY